MKLSVIIGAILFIILHPVVIYALGIFLLAVATAYLIGIAAGKFKMPARVQREQKRTARQAGTRWSVEFL